MHHKAGTKSTLQGLRSYAPFSYHDIAIGFAIAVGICLVRIGLFDREIFAMRAVPNHDSASAAAAFASTMHALVTEGDLAWWLPSLDGGYAQYYNQFLSPLMPTAGSPIFLAWAFDIRVLSLIGVRVPEYIQFLVFQHIFAPTVLYVALCLFLKRFVRSWFSVGIAVSAYAFGAPGLWNNSWMFSQEWTTIFAWAFSLDLFLERPNYRRLVAFACFSLVAVMSANYWTIFSCWFVLAILGGYLTFFNTRTRIAFRRLASGPVFWPTLKIASLPPLRTDIVLPLVFFAVLAMWGVFLAMVHGEHSNLMVRGGAPFSLQDVYIRAQAGDVRRFISELFNPIFERPLAHYKVVNEIHNSAYIGVLFVPLLAIFGAARWPRRYYVIMLICVVTYMVRMTSGVFLLLYEMPFLAYIRHIFYFYQYFIEVMLIVAGACGFDVLLSRDMEPARLRRLLVACIATGAVGAVALFIFSDFFKYDDPTLKSFGFVIIMLVLFGTLMLKISDGSRRWVKALAVLVVAFHAGDMARYYWLASEKDQAFSLAVFGPKLENHYLPGKNQLREPWKLPKTPKSLDGGLFENMPFPSPLWPANAFNPTRYRTEVLISSPAHRQEFDPRGILEVSSSSPDESGNFLFSRDNTSASVEITEWHYNRLRLMVNAPVAGTAILNMNYDPAWTVSIDDSMVPIQRANIGFIGFPMPAGEHVVKLAYSPRSRGLYWPIVYVTALCFLLLIGSARISMPKTRRAALEAGQTFG